MGVRRKPPLPHAGARLRHFILLFAACLAVYTTSLSGSFVWDDEMQIVKNPMTRSLANVPKAFTTSFWGFAGEEYRRTNFYRPIQTIVYSVAYAIGGLSPF